MNAHVNAISNRLSLRQPQRDSLEILARVCEIIELHKERDLARAIEVIRGEFPTVSDFEREFPSLCFALATGVGKTRLMGAFISYLFRAEGIRHYFVLAPNLTIYNKLIADFTPNTPKYVFKGIDEFANHLPVLVTGDNYPEARSMYGDMVGFSSVVINIFNISKINSEVRGGKPPRIKRLSEYIGESYFQYLSTLDDLVLIMDESHRYRATAGVRVLNELNPILGLELTATPQIETGTNTVSFKNVIYSYPLFSALNDGFVKEPAVATRENFDSRNYDKDGLERLKLEDGIRIHENTKVELEIYARQNEKPFVKPFILVVAQDTEHADALMKTIEDDSFFDGRYKGHVVTVHSNLRGEEKDDTIQQLLSVENPNNPVEIVIHVNMLKEGWDVTNLYTIVPLRAANSKTLVEQSIGRGLRLPYSKRTGVPSVDRLTIVSHDKFQEIVDEANRPDSIIRTGIVIGRDIPEKRSVIVTVEPAFIEHILGTPSTDGQFATEQPSLFKTEPERQLARTTLNVIQEYERLPRAEKLKSPEIQKEIVRKVMAAAIPAQRDLYETPSEEEVARVVAETTAIYVAQTIDIPRIIVVPKGEVTAGYRDFDLDLTHVRPQPVAMDILIQHLRDHSQHRLVSGDGIVEEAQLEDYLVRGLIDFNDISYDDHSELLYKLAGQLVKHLQSYLKEEDEVVNVLQYHQQSLVHVIHSQMQAHYEENAAAYEAHPSKGFCKMRAMDFPVIEGETIRNFRTPVDSKLMIRGMVFDGFRKCLYRKLKFDSDSERRFSVVLENDAAVLKWSRPTKEDIRIDYKKEGDYVPYEPDFVVETASAKYLCETKRADELIDPEVIAKATAAATWCRYATQHGEKPWLYLLIPHDVITENKTLQSFAASATVH